MLLILFVAFAGTSGQPAAETPAGVFIGSNWISSPSGFEFFGFTGIRYAQPPVGQLRFQDPQPIILSSPYYATEEGNICPQRDPFSQDPHLLIGSEDCLFLNVYTRNTTGFSPVMVWLHGGSWQHGSGSSSYYGPQLLLDEDIVLVTLNYRLGPLGFASFENQILPGNYGLKDQELALLWVYDNIAGFGGDPARITLAGQSAGAASALFHSKGRNSDIISRVIAQSGATFAPWFLSAGGSVRHRTKNLGEFMRCPDYNDDYQLYDCLMKAETDDIFRAVSMFSAVEKATLPFRPVLEPEFNPVIPEYMNATSVPLLIGFNSDEMAYLVYGLVELMKYFPSFQSFLPLAFTIFHSYMLKGKTSLTAKEVMNFYVETEKNYTTSDIRPFIDMSSDVMIIQPVQKESVFASGPIYKYHFNYQNPHSDSILFALVPNAKDFNISFGAVHGEELRYLFRNRISNATSEEDMRLSSELVRIWTSFVGDKDRYSTYVSNSDWSEVSEQGGFLEIESDHWGLTHMDESNLSNRLDFWNEAFNLNYR